MQKLIFKPEDFSISKFRSDFPTENQQAASDAQRKFDEWFEENNINKLERDSKALHDAFASKLNEPIFDWD